MLLAAAAVLVAIRWDDIGQTTKLASMVAVTIGLVVGGRRLSTSEGSPGSLPVTGNILFHLGALLVPFDMAAVSVLAGQGWQTTLLLAGLTGVVAWYGLARIPADPRVLLWSGRVAVVVLAAGIAAVSPIAAPLVVAVAAVVAAAGLDRVATVPWLGAAAVAPMLTRLEWPPRLAGAAADLGMTVADRGQLLGAGIVAVAVALWSTWKRPSLEMVAVVVVAASATAIGVGLNFSAPGVGHLLGAGLFVAFELGALALRGRFAPEIEGRIRDAMLFIESLAALFGLGLVLDLSIVDLVPVQPATAAGLAAAGFGHAVGWLIADRRRIAEPVDWLVAALYGGDRLIATAMVPLLVGYSTSAIAGATTVAVVLAVMVFWLVTTLRTFGHWVGLVCGFMAVMVAPAGPATLAIGAGCAAVMIWASDLRFRDRDPNSAYGTTLAATVMWTGAVDGAAGLVADPLGVAAWILGLAAMAVLVDPRRDRPTLVGLVPFVPVALGATAVAVGLMTGEDAIDGLSVAVTGWVVAAAFAWWARRAEPPIDSPNTRAVVVAVDDDTGDLAPERFEFVGGSDLVAVRGLAGLCAGTVGLQAILVGGWGSAWLGLALVAVALGLGVLGLFGGRWEPIGLLRSVFYGAGLALTVGGLRIAGGEVTILALSIVLVGATVTTVGLVLRSWATVAAGWLAVCGGIWLYLAVLDVEWIEPYLAAPAIGALAVGSRFYRTGTSSWMAFAPPIATVSMFALVERLQAGSAWHSVIAAGVGVLAMVVGGWQRLTGPLAVGAVAALAVTAYELVGPASLVPTWGWLALGGTTLIAAAVALETQDLRHLRRDNRGTSAGDWR